MKHKLLHTALAAGLTVGIVLAGIWVPWVLLQQREQALISGSGVVEGKTLTPYGNDTQSLISYHRKLDDLVTELMYGDFLTDDVLDTREPLDSELSAQEAEEIAAQDWTLFLETFESYGWPLGSWQESGTVELYDADETVKISAAAGNSQDLQSGSDGYFVVSPEDSTAAIWLFELDDGGNLDGGIILDAVLGLPILLVMNPSGLPIDEYGDAAAFWMVCAQVMDTLYDGRVDFSKVYYGGEITMTTRETDSWSNYPTVTCSGSSNGLTLTVQIYSDGGSLESLVVWITA